MVDVNTYLTGNAIEGLSSRETKIRQLVLRSAAYAMIKVYYDQLKINTSGAGVVKKEKNWKQKFVGPLQPGPPGVVTGTLHDAVYHAYSPDKSTDTQRVHHAGVNHIKAPHWHMIEYGTSRSAQHPYMRPALTRSADAIKAGQKRMAERLKEL